MLKSFFSKFELEFTESFGYFASYDARKNLNPCRS